ncbi:MAG: precorrin-4 C(11)-methyltransferase [Bacteroides sp.]
MNIAIFYVSAAAQPLAETLRREFPDAALFATTPAEGVTTVASAAHYFATAFAAFDAHLFIGALGICVRAIAPCLVDKYTDPAVVCIDSTGRFAVSVLSGHLGGANELTGYVARILGAKPVITTQSDCSGLWALDTLGSRFGWKTVPCGDHTLSEAVTLFVNRVPTALLLEVRDEGTRELERTCPPHVDLYYRYEDIDLSRYRLVLLVTPFVHNLLAAPVGVYFAPPVLHLGVGLAHQAGPASHILTRLMDAFISAGLLLSAVKDVSSIEEKRGEPVLEILGETYPLHFFSAAQLCAVPVPHPSEVVAKHVGTPSVCEAAAILASSQGPLVLSKQKGSNFTFAIALDAAAVRSGHIEIVGAGPGDPELISVRGRQLLEAADLILYAGSLVPRELTACAKTGATVRSSASMNLDEQFALMKEFYDRGLQIVRLHTGDPCIYGAIQEQMNYFDRHGMRYHLTPGISSFQAAAAALRSQFTIPERVQTIILTRGEGRTKMPEREQLHLLARSQSTLCLFLSAGVIDEVQQELLAEYPPTTPVAACYHLTWKDERIYRGQLKDLAALVKEHQLTLTTMIVVGEAIDNREGLSRLYAPEFNHLFRH